MSLKHTWSTQIKNDAGAAVTTDAPLVILGEAEVNFYVEVAASGTEEIDVAVTVADIQSGFLSSDKAVTIDTNASNGAGGQEIELTANKAFAWNTQMTFANPFTPNITKIFVHNNGATTAKVRGGFLVESP